MTRRLIIPVLLLTLLVEYPAFSADYQKGLDAYKSGDYATALREFEPLAEQGHDSAQFLLGLMYDNGRGVPQNNETAVKWFTLAAEQGYARAQTNLGVMYGNGEGVPQDYVRAHMWLNVATISEGDKNSSKNRDIVAQRMSANQIKKAQKLARECVRREYKGC